MRYRLGFYWHTAPIIAESKVRVFCTQLGYIDGERESADVKKASESGSFPSRYFCMN